MSKMKRGIVEALAICIVLVGAVSALNVTISSGEVFNTGDSVSFNYTIVSPVSLSEQYAAGVVCPSAPLPPIDLKNLTLEANVPFNGNYVFLSNLTDSIDPQTCNFSIAVFGKENQSARKTFALNTLPRFNFSVSVCKDSSCAERASVFKAGEKFYLDYNSSLQGVSVNSEIVHPNGEVQKVNLPYSGSFNNEGNYELLVNATKPGYNPVRKTFDFAIIKKSASIGYTALSSQKQTSGTSRVLFVLLFVFIAAALAIVAVLIILRSKNKKSGKR